MSEPIVFHVEIRNGLRHARAFNVEPDDLRRRLLEPWARSETVELGDSEWVPEESRLRVLEGVRLAPADLAHGQGWHHAERSARDVTAALLRAVALQVPIAVRAPSAETAAVAAAVLARLGGRGVDWAEVRARLLDTGRARAPADRVAGALLLVGADEPDAAWLLDAGLAIGALGRRTVVARLTPGRPDRRTGAVAVDPREPSSVDALAARLRDALDIGDGAGEVEARLRRR